MTNIIKLAVWSKPDMTIGEACIIAVIGICVVLTELALLSVFIKILSGIIGALNKKKGVNNSEIPATAAPVAAPAQAGTPLPESESEGTLDLVNVDEPTAACIMAIVSNESGIPLNRLSFKSIKLLEDK